jgi:hypothetical protein
MPRTSGRKGKEPMREYHEEAIDEETMGDSFFDEDEDEFMHGSSGRTRTRSKAQDINTYMKHKVIQYKALDHDPRVLFKDPEHHLHTRYMEGKVYLLI